MDPAFPVETAGNVIQSGEFSEMRRHCVAACALLFVLCGGTAGARQTQTKPSDVPKAPATFDAAAIRRLAAQRAEFRTLLSDPDPTVRLATMQEAIRAGDASQRQMAIDAGLASNESAMVEMALRGVMANIQQIVMEFVDAEGKSTVDGRSANFRLTITHFDTETGHVEGTAACANNPKWSGQLQGTVLSFNTDNNWCSGVLNWTAESGDFRGRVNTDNGSASANRNAVWKPR
ncbi:MAG: hypothetical protein ACRYG6_07695 [Janthinobacterium lividum]